jgi:TPP-dependent pyruvate/acetoin dehydrogenase alpha subunit
MAEWRARDPVVRFRQWLDCQGWWDAQRDAALRRDVRHQVRVSIACQWCI